MSKSSFRFITKFSTQLAQIQGPNSRDCWDIVVW